MLIFEYGILGLDPRFLGFGHGIENGGQFANGGDEGDLFEFAYGTQLPVELADHRIAADGGAWSPDRVRHGSSGQAEGRARGWITADSTCASNASVLASGPAARAKFRT